MQCKSLVGGGWSVHAVCAFFVDLVIACRSSLPAGV